MLEGEDLDTDEGENEGVDSAKSFIEAFQMGSLATYQGVGLDLSKSGGRVVSSLH